MRYFLFIFAFTFFSSYAQSGFDEATALFIDGDYERAEPLLKKNFENNPKDLKTVENLGDVASQNGDWDKAIEYYKVLVEADENNANYHYKYGGAMGMKALEVSKLKALGMIGDIKKAFKTAAELDPKHIDVRWALVEFYMQLPAIVGGSEETAMLYAKQLEDLSKVDGYLAMGYIAEYSKRAKDAEKYYKKAIEVGGSVTCYQKLTNLYENTTKEPQKAITNIEECQEKHHRNALHYQIGKICAQYNVQLEKGLYSLELYVKNYSPKDGVPKSWAYYRLAQIHRHRGNKREALNFIQKALKEKDLKPFRKEKEEILSL